MVDPAAFPAVKQKGGGTGPFKLGEWVPGDHLTFVRNDGYWQPGLPYLDRVVFRVLSDAGAMDNAFRAGQIDVAHTIPNKDAQRLRGEGLQVQPAPVPNEYYVVILNTRKPPFDNLKVRQAMRYLLDRETIAKTILGGIGKAQVQVAAPGTPAYDPKHRRGVRVQPREGPRAPGASRARRQDDEVGGLVSTSTQESPEIAQIVQGDLKKAGFDVNLTIVEPSRYFPIYFGGNFEISFLFLTLATIDPTDFTISSAYRLNATIRRGSRPGRRGVHRGDPAAQLDDRPARAMDTPALGRAVPPGPGVGASDEPALADLRRREAGARAGRRPTDAAHPEGDLGRPVGGAGRETRQGRGGMAGYLVRRGLEAGLTILVASVLVFAMVAALPGDPAQVVLGDRGTPEQLRSLRQYLGLDAPIPLQYARWLGRVVTGDLGYSMLSGIPVRDTLVRTVPVTLQLAAWSLRWSS